MELLDNLRILNVNDLRNSYYESINKSASTCPTIGGTHAKSMLTDFAKDLKKTKNFYGAYWVNDEEKHDVIKVNDSGSKYSNPLFRVSGIKPCIDAKDYDIDSIKELFSNNRDNFVTIGSYPSKKIEVYKDKLFKTGKHYLIVNAKKFRFNEKILLAEYQDESGNKYVVYNDVTYLVNGLNWYIDNSKKLLICETTILPSIRDDYKFDFILDGVSFEARLNRFVKHSLKNAIEDEYYSNNKKKIKKIN